MNLAVYKMRYGGKSLRFFSVAKVENLSSAESLLCAFLSRTREKLLLDDQLHPKTVQAFLDLVSENELTGYVLETIYLFKLDSKIRSVSVNYHGTDVDLLTLLTRQAGLEAIKFEKFEKKFLSFLELLDDLKERVIWLKGIVTSRTCYSSPEYRLSGDFDCFIEPEYFEQFFKLLYEHDFRVIARDTGFCNQLGVGPVNSVHALFLAPSHEYVPSAICGMYRNRWPLLDIKVNPLDRGIRMVEFENFKQKAISVDWRGTKFSAPDLLYQLMISLTHFEKDRFHGWKQILDIKLLCEKVNQTPELWPEFVRRCRVEGVSTACAAGISLAQERLGLQNVEEVINQLAPTKVSILHRIFTFTVTPLFYWNTSSLVMLIANAIVADDSARKFKILKETLWPNSNFLADYYCQGKKSRGLSHLAVLMLHWAVVALPGGFIRRTFGKKIWDEPQFGTTESY